MELFLSLSCNKRAAEFSIMIIMKRWSHSCKIKVFSSYVKNAISHIPRHYAQISFFHFCKWQPLNAIIATWQDYFYYIKRKKRIKMILFQGVICHSFSSYQGTDRRVSNLNTEIWPHIWISYWDLGSWRSTKISLLYLKILEEFLVLEGQLKNFISFHHFSFYHLEVFDSLEGLLGVCGLHDSREKDL